MNNYVEGPGSADRLAKYITVSGGTVRQKNSFYMTSVSVAKGTPLINLFAMLNSHYEMVSNDSIVGNQTNQEYEKVQDVYMSSAENAAKIVAYKAANKKIHVKNNGIYVLDVMNKSTFYQRLKPGDVLQRVNKEKINNSSDALTYMKNTKLNQPLTLTVQRGKKHFKLTGKSVHLQAGRNGIGISLVDAQKVSTIPNSRINAHGVGGPSAGLMYALQMYSELVSNFKIKENIAGTGTIDDKGNVGEIGGIDKKIITANQKGIKIFLTPYVKGTKDVKKVEPEHLTNYELAEKTVKKYHLNIKIIPITSFNDAIKYLKES
ncbi:PDZ domain family protein [Pediococcus claussenii ATCC BAA-344]|uniref:PDZ domain family protein n=2 Tax=Pediococcus claussenii TaxID=187452 RepID=G8PCY0_PEDCP|nr:PDZ domain family protein [Pediococcus claussenii ATCC BAA-344]KRN18874.1 hypothetical protein IV79_GL000300 [Pediococcus claussenii]